MRTHEESGIGAKGAATIAEPNNANGPNICNGSMTRIHTVTLGSTFIASVSAVTAGLTQRQQGTSFGLMRNGVLGCHLK